MEHLERMNYRSKQTQCYTYFQITGDFEPDIIFDMLNLKPENLGKSVIKDKTAKHMTLRIGASALATNTIYLLKSKCGIYFSHCTGGPR